MPLRDFKWKWYVRWPTVTVMVVTLPAWIIPFMMYNMAMQIYEDFF